MLPVTEELSDYHSEQANEINPCSELNPFLNMFQFEKISKHAGTLQRLDKHPNWP